MPGILELFLWEGRWQGPESKKNVFFGKNQIFLTCRLSWGHGIGPRGMPIPGKVPTQEGFRMGLVFWNYSCGKAGGKGWKEK